MTTLKTDLFALTDISTDALLGEILRRGADIREAIAMLMTHQDKVVKALDQFDEHATRTKAACQQVVKTAEQTFKDLISTSKDSLKSVTETARQECATITKATETTCLSRVEATEATCLGRVEAVETMCRTTVQTVTEECNRRAEAAESEALRCIEQADRATAAADALGRSFNVLNERLHGLEVSIRTLFSGGVGLAPVYNPAGAPSAPAPAFVPPPPPPAPVSTATSSVEPAPETSNGKRPKMEVVLLGLHQKDIERIRQRMRQPTQRGVSLVIVENTSKEALPKHADYAIVSGALDLAMRWKLCLETYGSSKCVRLNTGSLAEFREKIEQLYEARYPFHAPANLNPVNQALSVAARSPQ